MGYWSVFASVDYMDAHSNYLLPMAAAQALDAAETALAAPGRVECQRSDAGLDVLTVKHTPAWAWAISPLVLLVRVTRRATVTVTDSPQGAVLSVRGKLDTAAATRLRALAAVSGRDVLTG